MSIEEFFGTLLQSVTETHMQHLKTASYSNHKALNEYYEKMPDLIDTMIEHFQGQVGKVGKYVNAIESSNMNEVTYLQSLLEFAKSGYEVFERIDDVTKIFKSDLDAIVGLISSTLYQLKELTEGMKPLKNYILEKLDN